MVEKIKFKLPDWNKCEELVKKISTIYNIPIEERDADLMVENQNFSLRYHPDDRKFGFISIKIYDESTGAKLKHVLKEYQN